VSGWLFDTDILSALAPGRRPLPAQAVSWFEEQNENIFFSAVTVMEIHSGIAKLRRLAAARRAEAMQAWLRGIFERYGDRILSFDAASAEIAGGLSDAAVAVGRHPGFADVQIAAIAILHGLVVLTANRRHFEPLGVEVLNPFEIA
jgi:toxin FitB